MEESKYITAMEIKMKQTTNNRQIKNIERLLDSKNLICKILGSPPNSFGKTSYEFSDAECIKPILDVKKNMLMCENANLQAQFNSL